MPSMRRANGHKAPADNSKSWSIPLSAQSTRCRSSFDREFHRPDETDLLRQETARRGPAPFRHIARPDRRRVVRFFSAYGDVVNRVSSRARVSSGERTPLACWLWHSSATNFSLPPAEFALGQQYKSSRWQMPSPARCKRALPQKSLAEQSSTRQRKSYPERCKFFSNAIHDARDRITGPGYAGGGSRRCTARAGTGRYWREDGA